MTDSHAWWTTDEAAHWAVALRALARGFTYPDAEWVGLLLDGRWVSALEETLGPLGCSAEGLREAVAALPQEPEAALLALQVEYTYLFINAIPHVPAPPYASAYRDPGWLMGEPAEAALRAYWEAGLALAEDYRDLPDHIAAELEFLAWLGVQALEAGEEAGAWIARQRAFLEEQVRPWLPTFCQRVREAARIPFYREMAHLAERVIAVAPLEQAKETT